MNRVLLTLLALLTGLVAQAAPGQAAVHAGAGAEINAVEVAGQAASAAVAGLAHASYLPAHPASRFKKSAQSPAHNRAPGVATVLIGIDRALD